MGYIRRIVVVLIFALLFVQAIPVPGQETNEKAVAPANRGVLLEEYRNLVADDAANSADAAVQRRYIETVLALGYYDLAARYYEDKLTRVPDDTTTLCALGEAWMNAGPFGYEKSFDALHHVLSLDSENVQALTLLAELCHRVGLYAEATTYYDRILTLAPDNVRAQIGKAVMFVRSGEIDDASAIFEEIGTAAQPYDVTTRLMLRQALFRFERTGGWFNDTPENHAAYARLLYRAGRITDAVLAARRAVTINAEDYATWNFIAAMQLQVGNLKYAEQAYGHSLDANPDQPDIAKQRRQIINQLTVQQQKTAP